MNAGIARVRTGFALSVLTLGLLVVSAQAWAQQHTTEPADGEPRLTLQQLRDGHYQLPLLGDEETPIRFRGGRRSIRYGVGATEPVEAGLVGDLVAFGDLDGDDVADAAVVAFVNTGGSGTFIHLLALRDREGTPIQAGRQFLGDRVRVKSIAISGGHIFVTMDAHGPGDGLCCPSIATSRAFTLRGRRLVPTRALVIAAPLPGRPSRRASRYGSAASICGLRRTSTGWSGQHVKLAVRYGSMGGDRTRLGVAVRSIDAAE